MRNVGKVLGLMVVACLVGGALSAQRLEDTKFTGLKFSLEEVELLRVLKRIEDAATVTQSMLRAVPFVQVLSSSAPQDLLVTVTMNDWELIGPAIAAMGKIRACRVSSEIALFQLEHATDRRKHPNRQFFEEMRQRYDPGC